MVDDDPLISSEETAQLCRVSPQTLVTWRCRGRGPRYVKIGRAVFYRQSAIQSWLRAMERDPVKASSRSAA